jgi:hypothetical protein
MPTPGIHPLSPPDVSDKLPVRFKTLRRISSAAFLAALVLVVGYCAYSVATKNNRPNPDYHRIAVEADKRARAQLPGWASWHRPDGGYSIVPSEGRSAVEFTFYGEHRDDYGQEAYFYRATFTAWRADDGEIVVHKSITTITWEMFDRGMTERNHGDDRP